MAESFETKEAKFGSKMIEVKVRFWTHNLADGKDRIRPKHGTSSGIVRVTPNKAHGITTGRSRQFRSLADMSSVVETVLIEHGIKLHPSNRAKKLIPKD